MRRRVGFLLALGLAGLAPASAHAAPPSPFGHACAPQDGVLFCPTTTDAARVPSFDGVPLDVDVTLPASGDGPFPTIVMLHGWTQSKSAFESHSPDGSYNNVFYAQQGYAVVNHSARGFGRSCGAADSRTSPGCDSGWLHLADQRYEARDTQHLLGLLVDQGLARPGELGVTGISYGGIQSLMLARLRNRVRMADGSFQPWTSPAGTPLAIKAAYPRWGGSDMAYALQPNGRFLDFTTYRRGQSIKPGGVFKQSYNDLFYNTGSATGFYGPENGPFSADISGWKKLADLGEPERPSQLAVGRELTNFHSWAGLSGASAALLVQNGWTDDIFPPPEALRVYRTFKAVPGAGISLQLGDLGHARGQNKANAERAMISQATSFFAAYLKGEGLAPRNGSVLAFTQTCPQGAPAGGPFRAESWERLHPKTVRMSHRRSQRVTSGGGNPATAAAIDPIGGGGACVTVAAEHANGTAVVERRFRSRFTMLGLPLVDARIRTKGRGGFIAARLWDVYRGKQRLVSRGVYRLLDNQRGRLLFQLFGGGWRFAKGHSAKLELVGNDPNYLRASNFRFSVAVSHARVDLPGR